MREKAQRQAAILRFVKQCSLASQRDIVQHLRIDGFRTNQSSVSRDLRELGLVKVSGAYVLPGRPVGSDSGGEGGSVEDGLITDVEPVGANLVVIRTPPGAASVVAVQLDGKPELDIVGTVAGDDTIFVAVRSRSAQGRVVALLRKPAASA